MIKKSNFKLHMPTRHPVFLALVIFVLLVNTLLVSIIMFGGSTVGAKDSNIIELKVDNEIIIVPTRAKTVGEIIDKLEVRVGEFDKVVPQFDTPIIEDNMQIQVLRARPVVVFDNSDRYDIVTASLNPRDIAKEVGLELFTEDIALVTRSSQPLLDGVVAEEVKIFRSIPVTTSIYGELVEYRTTAKTVAEFLVETGIVLQETDTIQPQNIDEPIRENMFIAIDAKGRQTLVTREDVPFATETVTDPELPAGQSAIRTAGVVGERAVVYELRFDEQGNEVERRELQIVITRQPVNEVRVRGTQAISTFMINEDRAAIMRAAGISEDQFGSVDFIVQKESTWRPGAINAGGCIGLAQRCPSGGTNALAQACPNWQTDPVCQLQHFSAYANGRYGSWNNAYNFWIVQGWW